MLILAALAPILLVGALVLATRLPLIIAGAIGLAAAMMAAAMAPPVPYSDLIAVETGKGLWLAGAVAGMVFGGLLFHHAMGDTPEPNGPEAAHPGQRRHRAFLLAFLAAPFVESVIGFGIGFAVVIGGLLRLGVAPLPAAMLGYTSQMLVPWGALGLGTVIGAPLAGLPLAEFGAASAMMIALPLTVLLLWFWIGLWRAGVRGSVADHAREVLLFGLLLVLLVQANRMGAVDSAGVLATAPVLALAFLLQPGRKLAALAWRRIAPYGALVALLLLTRFVPGLSAALQTVMVRPFGDLPGFAPFHHAASLLLLTALGTALLQGRARDLPRLLRSTWRDGRIAVLSGALFLVMARLYTGSGMAVTLAAAWQDVTGAGATLGTPLFAALAGLLTGSNTASNGLMLPIQVALAQAAGMPVLWLAALQNITGSLLTPVFPGKVALAAAFAGLAGKERLVFRAALGYGALMTATCLALAGGLLLVR